jgi:hypothetical protein
VQGTGASTKKNIVRYVTNTTTKATELMLPSEFTDGSVTVYIRSSALTSAERVAPVARFLDYGSYVVDESDCLRPMTKVSERTFFDNPDLMTPYTVYPAVFAEVQGVPIFDVHWPLDAGWRVSFKVQVNPDVYTSGADEVGVPDSMEKAVGQFVYGKFLLEQGDTNRGLYEMRQGESRLLLNRGS